MAGLCAGGSPGGAPGLYVVPGMRQGLSGCEARALIPILSLAP